MFCAFTRLFKVLKRVVSSALGRSVNNIDDINNVMALCRFHGSYIFVTSIFLIKSAESQ